MAGYLKDLDLGYAPGTTWEAVKRSPASKAIAFAAEQGLVSVPDMALALASLPTYVLARTGELAGARAEADLRKEATVGDLVAALPGAAASALLERLGARRILGIGDALGSRSVRGVAGAAGRGSAVEGLTETGQEGIGHLTSRLGTATGTDAREMADAMMAGGAAGAIFGGGVRGATATGEALLGPQKALGSPQYPQPTPRAPPPNTTTATGGVPSAVQDNVDRPPLDPSRDVRVVETASRYRHLVPREARVQAQRDALATIRGTYHNNDTGWDIAVSRRGIRESLAGDGSMVRAEIVANLPNLLREAVRVEGHADERQVEEVVGIHRFHAPLRLDRRLNRVKLTVKEYVGGGRKYYAVEFAEMERPGRYTAPLPNDVVTSSDKAQPNPTTTLGTLLACVNYEDGTPIFPAPREDVGPDGPAGG